MSRTAIFLLALAIIFLPAMISEFYGFFHKEDTMPKRRKGGC